MDAGELEKTFFEGEIGGEVPCHDEAGEDGLGNARFAGRVAVAAEVGPRGDAFCVEQGPAVAVFEKDARALHFHAVDPHGHDRFRRGRYGGACRGGGAGGRGDGVRRLTRHPPFALRVLPPSENGFVQPQAADHELAPQERPKTEYDAELGGLEEINPGIFHVWHDQSAQADTIPGRVNGAAHIERQPDGVDGRFAQLFLHGVRLQVEVESEHGGDGQCDQHGGNDEAGAEAARHTTGHVSPSGLDAKREARVAPPCPGC